MEDVDFEVKTRQLLAGSPSGDWRVMNEQVVRQKIVDSNEPWIIREKLIEVGWEQQKLWCGDYKFFAHDFKKVGITRKKVEDLLNSIGKRFEMQLEEMLDYYDINIILLEGSWRRINPSNVMVTQRGIEHYTWDTIWNYLRRWWDKGFTPELTVDEGHTIHRLNALYALYQKPYSLSARSKAYTDDRVLAFPSGCRGKTGLAVLQKFGSLRAVAGASPDMLKLVDKVGDKKATLIVNHFNKEV